MMIGVVLVGFFALMACLGVALGKRTLLVVGKPLATASLFFVLAGARASQSLSALTAAIIFSLAGDIALLSDSERAFLGGLVSFLLAHICFVLSFVSAGAPTTLLFVGIPVVIAAWLVFLRALWPGLGAMRVPVMIYSAAAACMVCGALWAAGRPGAGPARLWLVAGAVAFFLSDANLGWMRFRKPYPHGQVVTLASYWLGQVGIVVGMTMLAPS